MIDSIFARDYAVVQGLTIVLSVLVSVVFLLVDALQALLDPDRTDVRAIAQPAPQAAARPPARAPRAGRGLIAGAAILLALSPVRSCQHWIAPTIR